MFNTLINIADSTLVNLVSKLGTARDKSTHNTFAWYTPKSTAELDNLYRTDSVARKIVSKPAQDMFRAGYCFERLAGKQLDAMLAEVKRLKLDKHLRQATKLARLHGRSYILLAANDNQPLSMPMNTANGLSYITALSVNHLKPSASTYQTLPASETGGDFDRPVFYQFQNINRQNDEMQGLIHHSRVIEMRWEDGEPVLQTIYDELIRFASVNANAASLVHESKIDVIKTPDLAGQIQRQTDAILKRFSLVGLLKSNNGTILLDSAEDYQSKTYSFGGLPDLMREFAIQTAGAADIPYTILFGQSPAGMNATGEHDSRNYYDTVAGYQQDYLKPVIDQLMDIISGYLLNGRPITLTFNPLWQLDAKTRSEVEKNNAERDIKYLEAGVIDEAQIAKQLVEEGTYTVIDTAHIKLLESMGINNVGQSNAAIDPSQG